MAFRFTDGCDSYAASGDLTKKWKTNSGVTWSSSAGRTGGGALQFSSNSTVIRSQNDVINPSTFVGNFGFWYKATAVPNALNSIFVIYDTSLNICGYLAITTGGLPTLLQLAAAQVITGSSNICDGNFHWIELYCTWQGSTVSKCHVDGVQQWNSSVGSLNNSYNPSIVGFTGLNGGATVTVDDLMVYDNTSPYPVNTDYPLGQQQITTLRPNGDSAVQFAPDTGATNYTQINEVNGDTTHYVSDNVSGHQDLYNYADMPFTPATIAGVMVNSYLSNPGVGGINFNQQCKSGSTTTNGASVLTPALPIVVQQPFAVDPNTGAAWTTAGLNAALFGIKVS